SVRTMSVSVGVLNNNYTTNGFLYSVNRFFQPIGGTSTEDTIDERKQLADRNQILRGYFEYGQKVFPKMFFDVMYDLSIVNDHPLQATYNRGEGKYDERIDSLSNNILSRTVYHKMLMYVKGKIWNVNYIFGVNLNEYNYRQKDQQNTSS